MLNLKRYGRTKRVITIASIDHKGSIVDSTTLPRRRWRRSDDYRKLIAGDADTKNGTIIEYKILTENAVLLERIPAPGYR